MKKQIILNLVFCFLITLFTHGICCADQDSVSESVAYRLAVGDTLKIALAHNPEIKATSTILPDGSLTLPLVGAVKLAGLTIKDAVSKLEKLYDQNYVTNATVTLNLIESNPQLFFIYGEVLHNRPQALKPGISVLMGIVSAGGFTRLANKEHVKILRRFPKKEVIMINIKNIEAGEIDQDIELQNNDIIVVPKYEPGKIKLKKESLS